MNCPHCGEAIEQEPGTITLSPTRVKNLWMNEWCPLCKKPKSWGGTLLVGGSYPEDEEGVQDVPETCCCAFWQIAKPLWNPVSASSSSDVVNVVLNAQ